MPISSEMLTMRRCFCALGLGAMLAINECVFERVFDGFEVNGVCAVAGQIVDDAHNGIGQGVFVDGFAYGCCGVLVWVDVNRYRAKGTGWCVHKFVRCRAPRLLSLYCDHDDAFGFSLFAKIDAFNACRNTRTGGWALGLRS